MAETDVQALTVEVSANLTKFQNNMAKMPEIVAKAVNESAAKIIAANANVKRSTQGALTALGQSQNAVTAQTSNMAAQFQDISTQLQSGTSPFTIAIQQGQQLGAVLTDIRARGGGLGTALSGAIGNLLNPINLLTIGFIALGGAAIQYFISVVKGGKQSEEALKAHEDMLNRLATDYAELAPAFAQMMEKINLGKAVENATKAIDEEFTKIRENINTTAQALNRMVGQIGGGPGVISTEDITRAARLQDLINQIIEDAKHGIIPQGPLNEALKLVTELSERGIIEPSAARFAITSLQSINGQIAEGEKHTQALNQLLDAVAAHPDAGKLKEYQKGMADVEQIGKRHLTDLEKMDEWLSSMLGKSQNIGDAMKAWETAFEKVPVGGGADALSKGTGDFLEAAQKFIVARENFIGVATKDTDNKFRVGFWSDTITDEFGRATDVTEKSTSTLAEAYRDLARRIQVEQNKISNAIGADLWAQLSDQQKVALVDIAYNYGTLPDRIVQAIKAGGGKEKIAKAIFDLGTDNGGVNRKRRAMEAELFAGEGGADFSGKITDIQELITKKDEQLKIDQKILGIQRDSTMSDEEKAGSIAALRYETEALNAAKEAGMETDPATLESIKAQTLATYNLAAANAALAAEKKKKKQDDKEDTKELKQLADAYTQLGQQAVSSFVQALRNGESAGDAFLKMIDTIIDGLINMAIQALFSKNALGGLISTAVGAPTGSSGGKVGYMGVKRQGLSPWAFAGAPRMAKGGFVGVGPGEYPTILHRGEVVIPAAVVRSAGRAAGSGSGGGGNTSISNKLGDINIDMGSGVVAGDSQKAREFGRQVRMLVQTEMTRQSQPGGMLTATGSAGRVGR
jgi:GH24 family phage-related lysozyme (muramidase)